jgi:hypothetical protein
LKNLESSIAREKCVKGKRHGEESQKTPAYLLIGIPEKLIVTPTLIS